ncbi:Gfo/Idh/MocA family oxidoreductase [Microbacterium sp. JZ70]
MTVETPRIGIVGIHGHGASHVRRALALEERGVARLVAVADPTPPAPGALPAHVVHDDDAEGMLARGIVDVAIISTPIHTHAAIAAAALDAGCDVLLEKPPTATLDEFHALEAHAAARGARAQVGFQSLGSEAVPYVRGLVADGAIGEVLRYGATGAWVRDDRYYARAAWAGRRRMGGVVVADGALTNPLAHASATALALAGMQRADDVDGIALDLFHANDIEADDTSVARFALRDGRTLTTAVTLCAAQREEPWVEVVGAHGTVRLYYTLDVVQLVRGAGHPPVTRAFGRAPLLENLLDARAGRAPLAVPLAETGAFMRLVDAVMAAPEPRAIPAEHWTEAVDDAGRHRVVRGVEAALHDALRTQRTFTELGAPFIC